MSSEDSIAVTCAFVLFLENGEKGGGFNTVVDTVIWYFSVRFGIFMGTVLSLQILLTYLPN